MVAVRWTAYGCFLLAGMSVVLAMAAEAPALLIGGVSAIVIGVGFLAADRGLTLLAQISASLSSPSVALSPNVEAEPGSDRPVRTAGEIAADIAALRARA